MKLSPVESKFDRIVNLWEQTSGCCLLLVATRFDGHFSMRLEGKVL